MRISRISLERYLELTGKADSDVDYLDVGHSWFASADGRVLGRVVLNPADDLWDAIAEFATSNGWATAEVDSREFPTLRRAEQSLVSFMAG